MNLETRRSQAGTRSAPVADSWDAEVDGFFIKGPTRARLTKQELLRRWPEPFMVELFRQAVRPGMTVLDIGAFLGQYTLLAARQVGSTGRVYAFEPDRVNFPFLIGNIHRNALNDRVATFPCAVAEKPGTRTFFLDPDEGSGGSLFFPRQREVVKIPVTCVALDTFLSESLVVDVIKLDVEGGESAALNGMEGIIRRGSPHLVMFVECFPRGLRSAGTTPRALVTRLEGLGFNVMLIDERHNRLLPITPKIGFPWFFSLRSWWGDPFLHVNLICTRSAEYPMLANPGRTRPSR